MTLRRRLDRLESKAGPAASMPPVEITLWIHEPTANGPRVCGAWRWPDSLRLDRHPGEAEADFRARAEAAFSV